MISTQPNRPPTSPSSAPQAAPGAPQIERGAPQTEPGDWFERYGIRHIAIIPDGNRRWARERGLSTLEGHCAGLLEVLPRLLCGLSEAKVHTLTFWGFSTENWTREDAEVDYLMRIFGEFLEKHILSLAERYGARLVHLGRIERLPARVQELIRYVTTRTIDNTTHVYNFALDYGGEDELNRAARRLAAQAAKTGSAEHLELKDFLDTAGQPYPNPDILVRSSGEQRMSGFMPVQSAYSEFFFVERPFPDFDMDLLAEIADQFAHRKRRFGS